MADVILVNSTPASSVVVGSTLVNSAAVDASKVGIDPIAGFDFDADDIQEGFAELAGELHDLENMPDLTALLNNALA